MSSRKGRRQPSRGGDSLPGSPAGACSTVRGAALLTVTGAQDKDVRVPKRLQSSLVQLALGTLKAAGLCIGHPALLTGPGGQQEVAIAWPIASFPSGKVGLSETAQKNVGVKVGGTILVQPLLGALVPAEEVDLVLRDVDTDLEEEPLAECLRRKLDRRVILPGNFLYFTFYIRPLELHVLGVKGADGGILGVPQSSRDQETEGLASEPLSTDISATDLPLQLSQLELGSPSPPVAISSPCTPQPKHNGSLNVAQSPAEGNLDLDVRATEDWEGWLGSAVGLGAKRNTDTFYFISSTTRIHFSRGHAEFREQDLPRVTYDMIGGLGPQLAALRRLIELPLTQPELFQRLGSMERRKQACVGSSLKPLASAHPSSSSMSWTPCAHRGQGLRAMWTSGSWLHFSRSWTASALKEVKGRCWFLGPPIAPRHWTQHYAGLGALTRSWRSACPVLKAD